MIPTDELIKWIYPMHMGECTDTINISWITGDAWKIRASPSQLKQTNNLNLSLSQSTNQVIPMCESILKKMPTARKERIEIRKGIEEAWKMEPLPEWMLQSDKYKSPQRIKFQTQQHTFLRSISWLLDIAFRYQNLGLNWDLARMEWMKQISEDMVQESFRCYEPIFSLQQAILRSHQDWDVIVESYLTNQDTIIPQVLEVLMDWCQIQIWIWNEPQKEVKQWFGRQWEKHPDHREALPVIIIWWNGINFQPVVWFDGLTDELKDCLRPLPPIWLNEYHSLWFQKLDIKPIEEPKTEPEQEPETRTKEIQIPKELKRGTKPYWQHVANFYGIPLQKSSSKTGKQIDKTIPELYEEVKLYGFV